MCLTLDKITGVVSNIDRDMPEFIKYFTKFPAQKTASLKMQFNNFEVGDDLDIFQFKLFINTFLGVVIC